MFSSTWYVSRISGGSRGVGLTPARLPTAPPPAATTRAGWEEKDEGGPRETAAGAFPPIMTAERGGK